MFLICKDPGLPPLIASIWPHRLLNCRTESVPSLGGAPLDDKDDTQLLYL